MTLKGKVVAFVDAATAQESFHDAAIAGLSRRQKAIPCRFLYDERGSALFERICETPEYYVTRTELGILRRYAPEIAEFAGRECQLVEFGSGTSTKVRCLLEKLVEPLVYVPIDISRELLRDAASRIAADFPDLEIFAVCADYTEPLQLPTLPPVANGRRFGFFPGSTIGNFTPDQAISFLRGCRHVLGAGSGMLIGVDLKKDPVRLYEAYNDKTEITAAFILNLLERMNRELDADFNGKRFQHEAFYNPDAGRIEIYVRSLVDQIVTVAGRRFGFAAGERMLAEYSYKFTEEEFRKLAQRASYRSCACWTDEAHLFSVHYLRAD